jgi:hypothetical protein
VLPHRSAPAARLPGCPKLGTTKVHLLPSQPVTTNPPGDIVLTPLHGDPRPLEEWLTTFHLACVVVDPYTNESSWILDTAARVLSAFSGSSVRTNFVVTASADEAKQFLGPLASRFLVFADPDRAFVRSLGLQALPAFVFLRIDGTVVAAAEGWQPAAWRAVADAIAHTTSWSRPTIPAPGDPSPFAGTVAAGV